MDKKIRTIGIGILVVLWVCLCLFAWLSPQKDLSLSERRPLQKLPTLSAQSLQDSSFMGKFEDYTLDQFPLRDRFRTLKSLFSYKVLGQKDNNGIYIADGYAAKLEYPLNNTSVSYALKRFDAIYTKYLADSGSQIYMTVIPDKGYYLAGENGYPSMDYAALSQKITTGVPWATHIDITGTLDIGDYYRTDTHWRQEKLMDTANALCDKMNLPKIAETDYTPTLTTQQFYGVYYGQAALPMEPEELYILESPLLANCRVYNYETKTYQTVYDLQKLSGTDPYDVYLSGAQALLTIENPNAKTDRELIVFRDSFGSSLAPLLAQNYRTVTLVDTRYIATDLLGQYLTFRGQDVLFAYSTLILNNSISLK